MPLPLSEVIAEFLAPKIDVPAEKIATLIIEPKVAAMGDFSLPCFQLAPLLKTNPKLAADKIAPLLSECELVTELKPTGPYLNFIVPTDALAKEVLGEVWNKRTNNELYAKTQEGEGKTVVIEYSSPNIAKPFGIGHLRSTVIGGALTRIYAAGGYKVWRLNYPGDWGTQFGLMLTAWEKWGEEDKLKERGVDYLVEIYKRANDEAKSDPEFADLGRAAFRKLEEGDEKHLATWQRFRDISLAEFHRVYELLGASFDLFDGEAATQPLIPGAVATVEEKGLVVKSDGADIIELGLGDNVPPAMIRKSDGATTYLARDLAAILRRNELYDFDKCIYVVGRDQELHFKQLFQVLKLADFDWAEKCTHVAFGMIRFGGGKMRTRTGSTIGLEDVLERAFEEVEKIVASRDKTTELDAAAQEAASREVGVGAVIFGDLSRKRIKDYDFDWERAFSLEGDSGPYLQYAHARSCGLLRRAEGEVTSDVDFALLKEDEARTLLKTIGRYKNAVALARKDDEPAVLASYLIELGGAINGFYNKCRVIDVEQNLQDARKLLVWAGREVLAEGLTMLGIAAPKSM